MFISKTTVDDLLRAAFNKILKDGIQVRSTKGRNIELSGVVLELQNPRARLSRTETKGTVFSCLGETLWYLAKSNKLDFIQYYLREYKAASDDGETIFGAYGPRLFKIDRRVNQVENVVQLLKTNRSSRKAVIQLFDANDITAPHEDVPCTCVIQLLSRRKKLDMYVYMRSNDAYLGLPHDIFAFTFLQELLARRIGVGLGRYWHAAASLHLYTRHHAKVARFLNEGWQPTKIVMPEMPPGDPMSNVSKLLKAEKKIRKGKKIDVGKLEMPDYWADLVRLLQIFPLSKKNEIDAIRNQMTSAVYDTYIAKKLAKTH